MNHKTICCISDTHGLHGEYKHKIPECDLLIHAGDCTGDIGQAGLRSFLTWFENCSPAPKVLIAGNHDGAFQKWPQQARAMVALLAPSVTYLEDESFDFNGTLIHGSPYTPTFFDWYFMRDRGADIAKHWEKIPVGVDILVTHGPPKGIMDTAPCIDTREIIHVGCRDLAKRIEEVKPYAHIFGHIHSGYGFTKKDHTLFVNASCCTEKYKMINPPQVFTI